MKGILDIFPRNVFFDKSEKKEPAALGTSLSSNLQFLNI